MGSTGRRSLQGLENGLRALRRQAEKRTKETLRLRSFGPRSSFCKRRMEEQSREGKAFHREEKVEWRKSREWTSRMRLRTEKIG